MGAQPSKEVKSKAAAAPVTKGNEICENCVKSNHEVAVNYPFTTTTADTTGSTNHDDASSSSCADLYVAVDQCMKQHKGQISACVDVWKDFHLCHDADTNTHRRQQAAASLSSLEQQQQQQQQHQ
jgi:hypothetical protein